MMVGAIAIGCGKSGDVLRLRDGTVLKLFASGVPDGIIEREFRAAKTIRSLGVRSADPIEMLTVDGQAAIRWSFVPGRQVLERVKRNPVGMAWALARLAWQQAQLHALQVADGALPNGKTAIAARITTSQAGAEVIERALADLAALPHGDRLCHGDLHLGNVVAADGRWTIIDWARAATGAPAGDAARTALLIRYGVSHYTDRFVLIRALRWVSMQFYIACYCVFARTTPVRLREWEFPLAVAWMQGQDTYRGKALERLVARRMR